MLEIRKKTIEQKFKLNIEFVYNQFNTGLRSQF